MDYNNFNSNKNGGSDKEGCKDIPCGFQDLDPSAFTLLGALVSEIMASNLPLNVQNSVGNWLSLVGQTMMTFAAQQSYFESGPGLCHNKKNKNISNDFCENDKDDSNGSGDSKNIEALCNCVNSLLVEVDCLKKEVRELKKSRR